jgi:hypothetical protein
MVTTRHYFCADPPAAVDAKLLEDMLAGVATSASLGCPATAAGDEEDQEEVYSGDEEDSSGSDSSGSEDGSEDGSDSESEASGSDSDEEESDEEYVPSRIVGESGSGAGRTYAVLWVGYEETEAPTVCHYMIQPLVELYGRCMVVLKVS